MINGKSLNTWRERCIQGGGRGMNKDLEVEMSLVPLEDRHGGS